MNPRFTLLATTLLVALSTAVLPAITGYGTVLFQVVVFGAWVIVAKIASDTFADTHHTLVYSVALVPNVLLFLVPAVAVWLVLRKRNASLCSALIVCWCLFYLASLFVLFPATDGP
jgi:hypothetical protein